MVDVHNGYLELNYFEYPYLTDLVLSQGLTQILKVIDTDNMVGSQTEKFIKPKFNNGSQVLRIIKTSDDLGSQVNKLMVDPPNDVYLGLQTEKFIDVDQELGVQTRRMIIDPAEDINLGSQIERFIIDPPNDVDLGSQIEKLLAPVFDGGLKTQSLIVLDKLDTIGTQVERMIIDPPDDANLGVQILRSIEWIDYYGTQITRTNLEHFVCEYYLNSTSYLTGPYLAGCINAKLKVQIDKGIFGLRNTVGAQVNRHVIDPPDDVYLPTQVDLKIDDYNEIGAQIEKTLWYIQPTGNQIEKFIYLDFIYPAQIDIEIRKQRQFGAQINKVFASVMAMQVYKRLYNITQLRILDEFLSRGTQAQGGLTWTNEITGGIAPGDYDVNNLNTDIPEEITKTATSERRFKIFCNTGIPNTFVDTIAILNHNFTASAVIDITGFYDHDAFLAGIPSIVIRPMLERENIYWISPDIPLVPCQYWRFDIQDVGNPYQLEMGIIVFGSSRLFTMAECFDNPVNYGYKHYKDQVETEGFTNYSLDRALRRNLGLSFSKLRYYGGNYLMLQDFFLNVKTDLKALIIPRPTKPSSMAVFAKLNQMPNESHEAIDDDNHYVSLSLEWDEAN